MYNNKGSALIFTLMVLLVLSVLGVTVLEISLYEYKASYAYGNNISVNYSAEAGLDIAKGIFSQQMMTDLNNLMNSVAKTIIATYKQVNKNVDPNVLYQGIYQAVKSYLEQTVFPQYIKLYTLNGNNMTAKINSITIIPPYYQYKDNEPSYPYFYIKVESTGTYGKLTRYGHATLILDLNKSGNPLSIQSWTIDNIPPSN
ncbi:PilX N-terminal domain-containing pilus assembly protein [Thermoanaerobacterium sp. RBIITD]|uniref:PilX N-terminal domain-containing pilus assembly protein n=1 Tax=Thermoanaerobacterium sp. RBIITD TaxID=1550240 RepID=UPI000BB70B7F|nr:PilX N-terminal domain-containing pilus assembly protein [Thermoanaerobacterium sp. RBIITD]SNX55346.1 hypothetical protein SAMN05660242_3169 [Thermoanaerobacterium sp. RBIITD]